MQIKNILVIVVAASFLGIVFLSFSTRDERYGRGRRDGSLGAALNDAYARELQGAVNELRRKSGLGALENAPILAEQARARAMEMAEEGTVSLTRPDGSDWSVLLL